MDQKRVFFAFEVKAPWPDKLPSGRVLSEEDRHLTVAFIGDVHYPSFAKLLPKIPIPKLKLGMAGVFNECIFLPPRHPNVVAWRIQWFDLEYDLGKYQHELAEWLNEHHFTVHIHQQGFLPHVTLCRHPFSYAEWEKRFQKLPVVIKNLHLYESLGKLRYQPLWTFSLENPFEWVSKRVIAIRGNHLLQLYHHAIVALAFDFPSLITCMAEADRIKSISEALSLINNTIRKSWSNPKSPFHSVELQNDLIMEDGLLHMNIVINKKEMGDASH